MFFIIQHSTLFKNKTKNVATAILEVAELMLPENFSLEISFYRNLLSPPYFPWIILEYMVKLPWLNSCLNFNFVKIHLEPFCPRCIVCHFKAKVREAWRHRNLSINIILHQHIWNSQIRKPQKLDRDKYKCYSSWKRKVQKQNSLSDWSWHVWVREFNFFSLNNWKPKS